MLHSNKQSNSTKNHQHILSNPINSIKKSINLPVVCNTKHSQKSLQVCDEQIKELHEVYPEIYINIKNKAWFCMHHKKLNYWNQNSEKIEKLGAWLLTERFLLEMWVAEKRISPLPSSSRFESRVWKKDEGSSSSSSSYCSSMKIELCYFKSIFLLPSKFNYIIKYI